MKTAIYSRYPSSSGCPKGGIESVTVVLVRALAQLNDMDVHVVTLEPKRTASVVEQDGDVVVHRLAGSSWPQVLDILVGPGRKVLVDYVTELKPDVLHTHETHGLGLGGICIPHVFTVHGFDHANLVVDSAKLGWFRSQLWKRVERRGLAKQSHIISITPYVRQMIEEMTNATIYDIENPVDERFFKIVRRPEQGRILCVGWINERKNILNSVKAFAQITGVCREAKLIIAGESKETDYFNRVKKAIEQHGISDRVELTGHITHTQLGQELARASVFLLPSRQENSPMAIAEAMAAGVPVVASNRCGMPYMVSEEQTGFLIDPESTDQIAQRLRRFIDSPQLCQQMGKEGRRTALERFHPRAVALRTREVYEQVCSGA